MRDTAVRLLIWDLDETFWHGTLTEGGVSYSEKNHDIVMELARRGIMSSICSKNDFEPVRDLLEQKGIWDYFIFPSIDWTSKGERLVKLIDDVQLRPETVAFVDDNAHNRALVREILPELRVFDVDAIDSFLNDPIFKGKDDSALTRLAHYKLLELKKVERESFDGDPRAFLRRSNIRVDIITDVEAHLPRAVELVNRTNQLNFTKKRLPDDPQDATNELRHQVSDFTCRAGLVSARDRYGDYGIVGFFLVTGLLAWGQPQLQHFCFSCRTLGMGVEQYVYDLLGRPHLDIVGRVLSDPTAVVDWINIGTEAAGSTETVPTIDEVRIRGGCELEVLDYLFRVHAHKISGEYQLPRGIYYKSAQHSVMLSYAASGLRAEDQIILESLGLTAEFTRSHFFKPAEKRVLLIFSPALDVEQTIWRHRETGLAVPIRFREMVVPSHVDYHCSSPEEKREYERVMAILTREFEKVAPPYEGILEQARRIILEQVPEQQALLIVLLPNWRKRNDDGQEVKHWWQWETNEAFRRLGAGQRNVVFIDVSDLIHNINEVGSYYLHYQRVVYLRVFNRILDTWRAFASNSA